MTCAAELPSTLTPGASVYAYPMITNWEKWHCNDRSITRQVIFVLGFVSLCLLLLRAVARSARCWAGGRQQTARPLFSRVTSTVTTSGARRDAVGSYQLIDKTHLEIHAARRRRACGHTDPLLPTNRPATHAHGRNECDDRVAARFPRTHQVVAVRAPHAPRPDCSVTHTQEDNMARRFQHLGRATRIAARIGGTLLVMAILVFLMAKGHHQLPQHVRGTESGLNQQLAPLSTPRFGINVDLEQYTDETALRNALEVVRQAGLGTVRQDFSWAELEPKTRRVSLGAMGQHFAPLSRVMDCRSIAVLDTSPSWARVSGQEDNVWAPPADPADYARFAAGLCRPFRSIHRCLPSLGRTQPYRPIGAAKSTRQAMSPCSKPPASPSVPHHQKPGSSPAAWAPTLEAGNGSMNDVQFLQEIYRLGAGQYFDILGARTFGFWSGPEDRRVSSSVLNFSRVILLREEMIRHGDSAKPIWALDGGWCALPANWAGKPSGKRQ